MSAAKAHLESLLEAGLDPYGADSAWMMQCANPPVSMNDSAGPMWCAECGTDAAAMWCVSVDQDYPRDRTEVCHSCGIALNNA